MTSGEFCMFVLFSIYPMGISDGEAEETLTAYSLPNEEPGTSF